MAKTIAIAVGLFCVSASAYAQPTPPECKDFPNGGRVSVDIPVVTVPPTCQACGAGFSVPSGFVLRFSNDHHDTCELKKPDGTNSGFCRADTTCPPGTTRTYQNNTLWVCQSGGGKRSIDCPAPPRVTDPTGGRRPPDPPACVGQLTNWEAKFKQREAEVKAAITNDAGARGQAGLEVVKNIGMAGVAMGAAHATLMVELNPIGIRVAILCGDYGKGDAKADQACVQTRQEYQNTQDRKVTPLYDRGMKALADLGTAVRAAGRGAGDPAGTVLKMVGDDVDQAKRQYESCMQQVKAWSAGVGRPF